MTKSYSINQEFDHDSSNTCEINNPVKKITKTKQKFSCSKCQGKNKHQTDCIKNKKKNRKQKDPKNPGDFYCPICNLWEYYQIQLKSLKLYYSPEAVSSHMNDKCQAQLLKKKEEQHSLTNKQKEWLVKKLKLYYSQESVKTHRSDKCSVKDLEKNLEQHSLTDEEKEQLIKNIMLYYSPDEVYTHMNDTCQVKVLEEKEEQHSLTNKEKEWLIKNLKLYYSPDAVYTHMNDTCQVRVLEEKEEQNSLTDEEKEWLVQMKREFYCNKCNKYALTHRCSKKQIIQQEQPQVQKTPKKQRSKKADLPQVKTSHTEMERNGIMFSRAAYKYGQFIQDNFKFIVQDFQAQICLTPEEMKQIENKFPSITTEEKKEVELLSKLWEKNQKIRITTEILESLLASRK